MGDFLLVSSLKMPKVFFLEAEHVPVRGIRHRDPNEDECCVRSETGNPRILGLSEAGDGENPDKCKSGSAESHNASPKWKL